MATVLMSGQWTSGAYRCYIDANEVDQLAIFDTIAELSDDEADHKSKPPVRSGQQPGPAKRARKVDPRPPPAATQGPMDRFCSRTA